MAIALTIEAYVDERIACPECGEMRVYAVTGAVCPNGCGKLLVCNRQLFRRRSRVAREKAARAKLPLATRDKRKPEYTVEGSDRRYKRTKFCKDGTFVVARNGSRRIYLVPLSAE